VAACIVGGVAGGWVLLQRQGNPPVNVATTVFVQLQLPKEAVSDPEASYFLDDKEVSRGDLARELPLTVGGHVLVVKKGGKVVDTFRFKVGDKDDKQIVQVAPKEPPKTDPPKQPVRRNDPAREPVVKKELPAEPSPAVKVLLVKLFGEDVRERCQAAKELANLKDRSAVLPLMDRVADRMWVGGVDNSGRSVSSKHAAVDALKVLAEERVTEALEKATKSETVEVRVWACSELGGQKDRDAVACLVAVLKDDAAPEVRREAARALVTSRPPAVAALARALFDDDVRVRCRAALTLGELGDPSLPPAIVKETADGAVAALMQRIGDKVWVGGVDNSGRSVSSKHAAADALRVLGRERVTEALEKATKSETVEVRVWACSELGAQKDRDAVACLVAVLGEDPAPEPRREAAMALVTSRPPAVAALARALFDNDVRVRCRAALTLGELGAPSIPPAVVKEAADGAIPSLVQRIGDKVWVDGVDNSGRSVSSKHAAVDALRVLGKGRVTEALLLALVSANEDVRHWACGELAEQKNDKEALAGLARAAEGDPSKRVQVAATAALGKIK
jgi:HEAT repeat protein